MKFIKKFNESWEPKNTQQLKKLYGDYLDGAYSKIDVIDKETPIYKYILGSGLDDYPPRKGVFIIVDTLIPDNLLETLKSVESDYVTIEFVGNR